MIRHHRGAWLFFVYYWVIFGIATFFGQFIPDEWRPTLSMAIFAIIIMSLFIDGINRSGLILSHVYAVLIGLVSYGTFEGFIDQFDGETFYKVIILSISVFAVFGFIGYFVFKDISGWGRFLFISLLIVIFAGLLNFFLQLPWLGLALNIIALLLYLGFTMYDFNRMKNNKYRNARVMGFNLFVDLLMIIRRILRLYRRFGNSR